MRSTARRKQVVKRQGTRPSVERMIECMRKGILVMVSRALRPLHVPVLSLLYLMAAI
jgi:hypothetical protein